MTLCLFLSADFTQTDPMPTGTGSSFEGSYVYAGARPTVMTDPGGTRFGLGGYRSVRNPVRVCWASRSASPVPPIASNDLGLQTMAVFGKSSKQRKAAEKPKSCYDFLVKMYDAVEGIQEKQRDGSTKTQKGLRARARDLFNYQRTGSWTTHKDQFDAFYEIAKTSLEGYKKGGEDGNGCPPQTDRDQLLQTEIEAWWLKSSSDKFLDRLLNPDDNGWDPESPKKSVRIKLPSLPKPPEIADTP
jgi:hypothetical protein